VENKVSNFGIPLLRVSYPDNTKVDYLHLKQVSPKPRQPEERIEENEECSFEGHLENEPKVYAFLRGGCPFDDSFEVLKSFKDIYCFKIFIIYHF